MNSFVIKSDYKPIEDVDGHEEPRARPSKFSLRYSHPVLIRFLQSSCHGSLVATVWLRTLYFFSRQ